MHLCIIWGLSVRCPASGFPEQVNVAVGVGGHHRVSGGDKEGGPGSITGLQVVDLEPPAGLETDPLDVVLLYHGMGRRLTSTTTVPPPVWVTTGMWTSGLPQVLGCSSSMARQQQGRGAASG